VLAPQGEVKDPARTIPKALGIVVVFVVLNYIVPIMAFTVVDSEWQSYANGYYVEIAFKLGGPLFAAALAFGQCISTGVLTFADVCGRMRTYADVC
jgi:amino acid transporter